MKNNKGVEFAMGWVVGIALALIALVVIIAFWRVLYNALTCFLGCPVPA